MLTPELPQTPTFDIGAAQPAQELEPKDTPIEPTTRRRIASLDIARGIAVMGILLANIPAFGWAVGEEMFTGASTPTEGVDRIFEMLSLAFVNGKFRAMLAILFGAGLFLQYEKRSQIEGNWPGGYLKRTLFLWLIGLVHGYLIWFGDILALYAIVSFGVCLLASASDQVRKIALYVCSGLSVLIALGMTGLLLLISAMPEIGSSQSMGNMLGDESQIFGSGSYLQQLGFRALLYTSTLVSELIIVPLLMALFLFGFEISKRGVFADPEANAPIVRKMLLVGLGAGLPLSMAVWLGWNLENTMPLQMLPELLAGPLLAAGYLGIVLVWSRSGFLAPIQRMFANVGRLALTNYLMQSVLCTTLFYSWGFGLFEKLNSLGLLAVVLGVWTVNLVFSALYLRRFRMGPVEWVWRCLTEGRKMPIRKSAEA